MSCVRLALALGVSLLLAAGPGRTQSSPPPAPSSAPGPAPACTSAAHRQFDFWIGEWDVTSNGRRAGFNRISRELGDCVLREQWEGVRGLRGSSFNLYDAARSVWHQTWVDSQGNLLVLEGRFEGGRMVLQGDRPGRAPGAVQIQRIAWTPISADSVRQLWETSDDGGKTWAVAFDGLYVRRAQPGK